MQAMHAQLRRMLQRFHRSATRRRPDVATAFAAKPPDVAASVAIATAAAASDVASDVATGIGQTSPRARPDVAPTPSPLPPACRHLSGAHSPGKLKPASISEKIVNTEATM